MNSPVAISLVRPRELFLMLRAHQWAKNLPLFAPLFLSGHDLDPNLWVAAFIAFVAFSLTASGGYFINDLLDLQHDRYTPARRHNLVATGRVQAVVAGVAGGFLILGGLACAFSINVATTITIAIYALGSLSYSAWFKRLFLIDCVVLAGLLTLRLAAGAAAIGVPMSIWLTCFAVPLFLSLALTKRCAQIDGGAPAPRLAGRNYHRKDRPLIHGLALVSAVLAVAVLIAYVAQGGYAASFYGAPLWLWGFPAAIALFLLRIFNVLMRGGLDTDPVAFALRDPISLAAGAGLAVSFFLARS